MMGKTHLIISTGITLSVVSLADEKITLPIVAITAISALLPDIDEPNALLLSRTLPTRILRLLQLALFCLGVLLYFFVQAIAPWNTVLAVLVGVVSFMPTRSLRKLVMVLIGVGLIIFGDTFTPWNYIIGSLLIICAVLPHRGLTHTLYGVIGWSGLLYFSTSGYESTLWIAGGLSYLLHLLADSLTNRGIRPLPPFKWRLKLNLMSTGTWMGSIVEGGFILLTFVLVFYVFIRHFLI
ncbi:metal-dependent hydrolase [Paenibacillus psychroresistens]|uniref:Metal-dependent hydrolase n=1 Tax=Paenibacillus psychroresistens TaxID=1778678 RepID=A0A6B8RQ71_9BACL|nr:metal-dependent hydrolase [Paenibacillus psychroresistens]QGQ98149.1 metal-dependent hydrolase [Paenibacillus psychroresistens]